MKNQLEQIRMNALEALERSEQRSRAVFPEANRYLDETWDEYP